jgi:hypothetical protein
MLRQIANQSSSHRVLSPPFHMPSLLVRISTLCTIDIRTRAMTLEEQTASTRVALQARQPLQRPVSHVTLCQLQQRLSAAGAASKKESVAKKPKTE